MYDEAGEGQAFGNGAEFLGGLALRLRRRASSVFGGGELRRQGVPLQVIRQALDRLQQLTDDPLRELTLVAIGNEVYVCRSREEVERATDGQLAVIPFAPRDGPATGIGPARV